MDRQGEMPPWALWMGMLALVTVSYSAASVSMIVRHEGFDVLWWGAIVSLFAAWAYMLSWWRRRRRGGGRPSGVWLLALLTAIQLAQMFAAVTLGKGFAVALIDINLALVAAIWILWVAKVRRGGR